jgi:hypothetical protein
LLQKEGYHRKLSGGGGPPLESSEMAKQRRLLAEPFQLRTGASGTRRVAADSNASTCTHNFRRSELLNLTAACAEYQLTSTSIVSSDVTLA